MAEILALAEVWLWGEYVGAVAEMDDRSITFEYADGFRRGGLEISPLLLPTTQRIFTFPGLLRKEAFNGLPGVLADALPDAFGTSVIRSYFTARGEMQKALSPVQHLLYVGARAIGALEFRPAEDVGARPDVEEAMEIAALVADARRIIEGEADVAIPEIYRIGSSAGGMRPKAVVLYNPTTSEIRSGFAEAREGDVPSILKFDGIGEADPGRRIGRPEPFNRVEAAYARMARDAGLDVVDIEMIVGAEGHAHLVIPRFDLTPGGPLHQHTLGGLLHVDYNDVGASSYEEYLRTIQGIGMATASVTEGYRRMAFNVFAINQDDHVKNLSFHMGRTGNWALTPAYDVTFARGGRWTATHQMRVAGKREQITRGDLLGIAERFGLKAPEEILQRIEDAVSQWK
ncbi:type II toxin-antitoxin system HipA family toxin, partial [Gemmatimonadota bacterium]